VTATDLGNVSAPIGADVPRARARPLEPDDRRAMIIEAVIPIIIEHGRDVTTRQLAEAAGIGEGTIFRAFGDKETLVRAAAERYFEPGLISSAIHAIDPGASLEQKVSGILEAMRERMRGVHGMMSALGMTGRPPGPTNRESLDGVIEELLAPNLVELDVSPGRVMQFIRLVSLSASIPSFNAGHEISTEELARMITYGIAGQRAHVSPPQRKSGRKPHAA
jgi:AcrR family transcriptional regulator